MSHVGISIGGSNVSVAGNVDNGPIESIANLMGHRQTPLYIQCKGPGSDIAVGDGPKSAHGTAKDKGTVCPHVGRWFGRQFDRIPAGEVEALWPGFKLGGNSSSGMSVQWEVKERSVTTQEIILATLKSVFQDVLRVLSHPTKVVYIAVPNYATPMYLRQLQDAVADTTEVGRNAVVVAVPAAVAAFTAFGCTGGSAEVGTFHMMVRVGETSMDAAILSVKDVSGPEIVGVWGEFTVGADVVDKAILEDISQFVQTQGVNVASLGPRALKTLRQEVQRVRTELYVAGEVNTEIDLGETSARYALNISRLATLVPVLLDTVRSCVERCFTFLPEGGVSSIRFYGGGCRCPLILETVKGILPGVPCMNAEQPDELSALGAAVLAMQHDIQTTIGIPMGCSVLQDPLQSRNNNNNTKRSFLVRCVGGNDEWVPIKPETSSLQPLHLPCTVQSSGDDTAMMYVTVEIREASSPQITALGVPVTIECTHVSISVFLGKRSEDVMVRCVQVPANHESMAATACI